MAVALLILMSFGAIDGSKFPNEVCEAAKAHGGAWFNNESTRRCLDLDINFSNCQAGLENETSQRESLQREVDLYSTKALVSTEPAPVPNPTLPEFSNDTLTVPPDLKSKF